MKKLGNKILTEKKTVKVMIAMYCKYHHNRVDDSLCSHCTELLKYSMQRIDTCVFGINKPSCERCPVHCYNNDNREYIRKVMKYSGPRMILNYPILAIKHLIRNINPKYTAWSNKETDQ